MKQLIFLCSVTALLCFSNNSYSQKSLTVAKVRSLDKLRIKNGDLTKFYPQSPIPPNDKIYFGEMKVAKIGKRYYLLSTVQNENRIFAFQLKKSWGKLKLKKYGHYTYSCDLKDKPVTLDVKYFVHGVEGNHLGCMEGMKTVSIFTKD